MGTICLSYKSGEKAMSHVGLSDVEKEEALRQYILNKLPRDVREHWNELRAAKIQLDEASARHRELQEACPHPLLLREVKNNSNTGNWCRDDDSYWAEHHCTMCGMRWRTGQGWENTGGKMGMPDDEPVRRY